ncbi:AzlC family ABC transporter permease [Leptolyngbya sp. AN03gr2]|uniref:AzlC family ABC transporter permease n=1 Tax=unclassified Leptolyngbya TaxID=2650499 RepID=UPI003D310CD8
MGATPFGILFGTLAIKSGVSIAATLAMSVFVFAGSAQFIAIGLIASGTPVALIWFTTFVVNLRHLLYAMSLLPYVGKLSGRWRLIIGFWLTDESFAVSIARYNRSDNSPFKHWYYLGAALFMYGNWQLCTAIGIWLGQQIPDATEWGLDFAMSVTFIGMVVPYIVTVPMLITVLVAGITALLTHPLPHQLGLLVAALTGVMAGFTVEQFRTKESQ